jgi:hypothetical protein
MTYEEAKKLKTDKMAIIWKDSFPNGKYDVIDKKWLDTDEFMGSDWEFVE